MLLLQPKLNNNPYKPIPLSIADAELYLVQKTFCPTDADRYFKYLLSAIKWKQENIVLFGKRMQQPRLTAWHADYGKNYKYSGLQWQPEPWNSLLLEIKDKVELVSGVKFNSVLLNLYRNGNDSMGWHSDDEPELGRNPAIASLSLGGTRNFQLKHRIRTSVPNQTVPLAHGNLLIMKGPTQHCWKHQIPKTKKVVEPRINLTFRNII